MLYKTLLFLSHKILNNNHNKELTSMPVILVSLLIPAPVIILPVNTHSLVAISAFFSLFFTVLLRIAVFIIHIIPISVTLTATVLISSHFCIRVLFKPRNIGLC